MREKPLFRRRACIIIERIFHLTEKGRREKEKNLFIFCQAWRLFILDEGQNHEVPDF